MWKEDRSLAQLEFKAAVVVHGKADGGVRLEETKACKRSVVARLVVLGKAAGKIGSRFAGVVTIMLAESGNINGDTD